MIKDAAIVREKVLRLYPENPQTITVPAAGAHASPRRTPRRSPRTRRRWARRASRALGVCGGASRPGPGRRGRQAAAAGLAGTAVGGAGKKYKNS